MLEPARRVRRVSWLGCYVNLRVAGRARARDLSRDFCERAANSKQYPAWRRQTYLVAFLHGCSERVRLTVDVGNRNSCGVDACPLRSPPLRSDRGCLLRILAGKAERRPIKHPIRHSVWERSRVAISPRGRVSREIELSERVAPGLKQPIWP